MSKEGKAIEATKEAIAAFEALIIPVINSYLNADNEIMAKLALKARNKAIEKGKKAIELLEGNNG